MSAVSSSGLVMADMLANSHNDTLTQPLFMVCYTRLCDVFMGCLQGTSSGFFLPLSKNTESGVESNSLHSGLEPPGPQYKVPTAELGATGEIYPHQGS